MTEKEPIRVTGYGKMDSSARLHAAAIADRLLGKYKHDTDAQVRDMLRAIGNQTGQEFEGPIRLADQNKEVINEIAPFSVDHCIKEMCEKAAPKLWRAVYPRAYVNDGKFGSVRHAAFAMWSATSAFAVTEREVSHADLSIYMATCTASRYSIPTFYIAPELLAAARQSEPPKDMRWTDMKLPFEAGILVLPKHAITHPDGQHCDVLGWARIRPNTEMKLADDMTPFTIQNECFVVWTYLDDDPNFAVFDSTLSGELSPCIGDWHGDFNSTSNGRPDEWNGEAKKESIFDVPMEKDEMGFLHNIRTLAFNLLLAMEARPALISHGRRVQRAAHKSARELWMPNIVGKDYKVQQERAAQQQGTHASPRLHWRRGHFRRQPYGPQRASLRTIWIEPTLIGA